MKTDGLFIVHEMTIPVKSGEPFHLVFFGDVHRDSPNHADEAWQTFLSRARSIKNRAWFFGMGDYLDATSTSERNALQRIDSEMHENVKQTLDEIMLERTEAFSHEIQFMKGRTIGLLNGNHYFRWSTGINSDQKLCELLSTTYLGVSAFVRLYLKYGNQDLRGHSTSLDIWAHHGTGAGRLLGSSITRVDQMREHAESDIYVMGHDHKRGVVPANPRLFLDRTHRGGLKVKSRQQWLVRSGSFLKSYVHGERCYNVDAGRGPCSLGHVELIVTPCAKDGICSFQIQGLA